MTLKEISFFLKKYVGKLIIAKNGKEGLEMFKEHRPDMIITDIQMPIMTGLEMAMRYLKLMKMYQLHASLDGHVPAVRSDLQPLRCARRRRCDDQASGLRQGSRTVGRAGAHYFIILPQSEFMGKGKAPKTLDDWKGLRVRGGGGLGDAMRILGAVPSTVPASEVYTAMERGTVDAAAFPHTYAHAAYQIHTVSSWFTNNMNPSASGCAVVTSKAA